ncbi:MAG: endonuclease domain-containing protein [Blastocatellia bacterium]|nr:endonuclease domain-containing protein [Blastocatellia bacterium]
MGERQHNRTRMEPRRKQLRGNLTPAEATLWRALKNSQLSGRKFRRQYSVGKYVVDFYCVEEWLAIELDGEVHRSDNALEYDANRTAFLNAAGIKVIRFENFLVFEEMEFVLHRIESWFGWEKISRSTTPSAEAAATPPIQEGSLLRVSTTPSAEAAATPTIQEGSLLKVSTTPSAEAAVTPLIQERSL